MVVIVGAGSVGCSIAKELLSNGHDTLLIDPKPEVIGKSGLRGARWLVGDACEISTLREAKLEEADVVVSATGDDKVNLVVSLLAKSEFGVGRTVGRVNNPKNDWMFDDSWGVDVAVNTPRLMTALVEEAVEIGDLVRLLTLQTGVASLVEFTVPADSHVIGRWSAPFDGRTIPPWWQSCATRHPSRPAPTMWWRRATSCSSSPPSRPKTSCARCSQPAPSQQRRR